MMTGRERIDRALAGADVDRPPFTFWYHFGLQKFPAERHAQATLGFHRKFRTDLVKVMSDYPFAESEDNPFPEQIRALEMIRDALGGGAYFVETIFNPFKVAEKTSSKAEVRRLQRENPQALLDRLENIAKAEAAHARRAVAAGAAGVFLAIANAGDDDYLRFGEPFDRMVLDAVRSTRLNILHLHGDRIRPERFCTGWPVAAISYSHVTTGIPLARFRERYGGVIMGGIDEVNYRSLDEAGLRKQCQSAREAAGARFILAPGCSVPDDATGDEMLRLTRLLERL